MPKIALSGTLIPDSVYVGASDDRYHAIYKVDTTPLMDSSIFPEKYRMATELPTSLHLIAQQSASRGRMYGKIAAAGIGKLTDK